MTWVSHIKKGNTIFNSNQSESWNSKFLKLCGAKKLTFPQVFQVFRMAQFAHLYKVDRAFIGLGEYTVKPRFASDSGIKKGKKLMEKVGQIRMDDVKTEVKRPAEAEHRQQGLPRLQGRGFSKAKEGVEELDEEVVPEGGRSAGEQEAASGAEEQEEAANSAEEQEEAVRSAGDQEEAANSAALVGSPAAPVASSDAPVGSPAAPVGSPASVVASPASPLGSPVAPVGSPAAPVGSPAVPVGSPAAVLASPTVPLGSPAVEADSLSGSSSEGSPSPPPCKARMTILFSPRGGKKK